MIRTYRMRSSAVVHLEVDREAGQVRGARGRAAVCGVDLVNALELTEHDDADELRACSSCSRMMHARGVLRSGAPLPGLFGGGVVDHGTVTR